MSLGVQISSPLPDLIAIGRLIKQKQINKNMKKIRNMIVGVFCALLLVGSALAADTNTVKATPAAPVAVVTQPAPDLTPSMWAVTLGLTSVIPYDFSAPPTWGGEIGFLRVVPVGKFNTDVGYRQGVNYGRVGSTVYGGGSTTYQPACETGKETLTVPGQKVYNDGFLLRSEVFWDWNVKLQERLTVFAGPSVSILYGDISPTWYAGPELGFKWDVASTWYIFIRGNYDFALQGCGRDDVRFLVGAGIKF